MLCLKNVEINREKSNKGLDKSKILKIEQTD